MNHRRCRQCRLPATPPAPTAAAWAAETALCLDWDGRLWPIVDDSEAARPLAGVVELLAPLATRYAAVALISGRRSPSAGPQPSTRQPDRRPARAGGRPREAGLGAAPGPVPKSDKGDAVRRVVAESGAHSVLVAGMTSATCAPSPPRPSLPRTGAGCESQSARRRRRQSCWQKPIWSSMVDRWMDDDLAYRVTRALFEHKAQLAGIEKEPGTWTCSPPRKSPRWSCTRMRRATTTRLWADARAVPDVARLERLGWRRGSPAGPSPPGWAGLGCRCADPPSTHCLAGWVRRRSVG
jgi:hypothetical protein